MAAAAVPVAAQVAGSTTIGVSPDEVKTLTRGWSAKKQILGKPVYNDQDERVGEVEDLIIAPDKSLSYAIIGVGGFLGLGTYHVAIPVSKFTWRRRENRARGRYEGHAEGDATLHLLAIKGFIANYRKQES